MTDNVVKLNKDDVTAREFLEKFLSKFEEDIGEFNRFFIIAEFKHKDDESITETLDACFKYSTIEILGNLEFAKLAYFERD